MILMEIDPLSMRGSMVMTMAMISPSRRDVSLAEQLHRSPRLVPPRGGGVSSRKLPSYFSGMKDFIQQKMGTGGLPGGPRGRGHAQGVGHASHPRGQSVAPSGIFSAQYFLLIPKMTSVKFQDFWSCVELVSNICSFSSPESQLPTFSLFM